MSQKIKVTNITLEDKKLVVFLEGNLIDRNVLPEGRMLVDSDHLSFIYILDSKDGFIYISFPQEVWQMLKYVQEVSYPVILKINPEKEIELTQFAEELHYLISNIDDNSNYGDEMVSAVNKVFSR